MQEGAVMLKSLQEREQRQLTMRDGQALVARLSEEQVDLLTVAEAAKLLRVSKATATNLLRHEPGVHMLRTPGSKRPIMRIPRGVIERILRRTANPPY